MTPVPAPEPLKAIAASGDEMGTPSCVLGSFLFPASQVAGGMAPSLVKPRGPDSLLGKAVSPWVGLLVAQSLASFQMGFALPSPVHSPESVSPSGSVSPRSYHQDVFARSYLMFRKNSKSWGKK